MGALNDLVKANLPKPARRIVRFVYRLPIHFRTDISYQICAEHGGGHGSLFIGEGISLQLPDHAIASSVFRSMAFETHSRLELMSFLRLAEDRTRLCDVGASGGFFSAIFARSRPTSSILSIEFDRPSLAVLAQTRERNSGPETSWLIDARGISDAPAEIEVASSGYGGVEASSELEVARAQSFAAMNGVPAERHTARVDRLATICADQAFSPDLIKVDIEGFEYEMVMSSSELFGDLKPNLAFELHVRKLRERGRSVETLLNKLAFLGYRIAWTGRPVTQMLRMVGADGCARAALTAS